MGRPPIPTYLKILRGNPGKRKLRPEVEPDRGAQCPEPPEFLSFRRGYRMAPRHARSMAPGAADGLRSRGACGLLRRVSRWKAAEEELAQSELVDGTPRANPLIRVARDACAEMVKIAGQFGMSPAARSRIAAGIGPQPEPPSSKFDGLI